MKPESISQYKSDMAKGIIARVLSKKPKGQELLRFLEDVRLPYTTFADWKKGRRFPNDDKLLEVAYNLNVSLEWLKYGNGGFSEQGTFKEEILRHKNKTEDAEAFLKRIGLNKFVFQALETGATPTIPTVRSVCKNLNLPLREFDRLCRIVAGLPLDG